MYHITQKDPLIASVKEKIEASSYICKFILTEILTSGIPENIRDKVAEKIEQIAVTIAQYFEGMSIIGKAPTERLIRRIIAGIERR